MSIVAYVGLPGSGKSYSVIEHQILPAIKAGRTVVTNIPMRPEAWAELKDAKGQPLPGKFVDFPVEQVAAEPDRIREYVTPGCVFVLDEVWRMFPAGLVAAKVPEAFKSLLAEHRHMRDDKGDTTQIVLVTQDLQQISAFARTLVENTFVTTKLTMVGSRGSYRVDVFHGTVKGAVPSISNRLRFILGRYSPEIFKLYKSHTLAVDGDASGANEKGMDRRANILLRPVFIIGAVLAPLLIWYGLHTFSKAFHGGLVPKSKAADSAPAGADARSVATSNAPAGGGGLFAAPPRPATGAEADQPPQPRLVVFLQFPDGSHVGFVSDGQRIHRTRDCRFVDDTGEWSCRVEQSFWDIFGRAKDAAIEAGQPPHQVNLPVARYSSAH